MEVTTQPTYIRYVHIVVYLALFAIMIPVYQIMTKVVFCGSSKKSRKYIQKQVSEASPPTSPTVTPQNSINSSGNVNKVTNKDKALSKRLKILLSVSISLSVIYLILTSIQTSAMFMPHTQLFIPWCTAFASLRVYFYCLARVFLYFFFLLRAHETFKDSSLEFKTRTLLIMALIPSMIFIFVVQPLCWIHGSGGSNWYVACDQNGSGNYCIMETKTELIYNLNRILFMFGQFMDILYAYLSVHLLVSKLFTMIYLQIACDEKDKRRYTDMEINVSMQDVEQFHWKTYTSNKFIKMISKLLILLLAAVISSQFTIVMYLILPDFIYLWYSLDTMINIYTFWLSFHFAEKYYASYFGGNACIRCCFPFVKTLALTCNDECNKGVNDERNLYIGVCCCCCYGCKHCINTKDRKKGLELYIMSKAEIELVLNS